MSFLANTAPPSEAAALQQALARRFELRSLAVRAGAREWELFAPAALDPLLDQLADRDPDHPDVRDERLPYWAELWPSARALADFLPKWNMSWTSLRILEIGCGLGLPGLVAAELGASVTWTDYQPDALTFVTLNGWHNLRRRPIVRRMDWRRPRRDCAADLILAADVVYETRAFRPLASAFKVLLRPGASVLLAEPNRAVANPFFQSLPFLGFDHEVVNASPDTAPAPVTIHRILRCSKDPYAKHSSLTSDPTRQSGSAPYSGGTRSNRG